VFAAKQTYEAGLSAVNLSAVSATSYLVSDEVDAASGTIVSYTVATWTADGEAPQQQCVIGSNDGESSGQTSVNTEAIGVQINVNVTGADATLGISGIG
jgi:hypothetical protein